MAEHSSQINYTFEDIQRYLQGQMSAAEMHAMEKAALQDPFLADAIEGYREIPSSVAGQHLIEINAALSGEPRKSKIVSFGRNIQWMRIAALVIVLAGIGVIASYIFNKSNLKQEVAQVKNEKSINSTAPALKDTQENKTDTARLQANEEENNTAQTEKKEQEHKAEPKPEKITNEIAANNESQTENQQADVASMKAAPIAKDDTQKDKEAYDFSTNLSANKKSDSLQNQGYVQGLAISPVTISGKVLDENGQPVPGVIVQSVDKKEAVLSNSDGDFSLHKQDSLADISAAAVGFQNKNARLKAGSENLIVLQPDSRTLNEVVVTALGVKKSDSSNNKGAAPVGGWQNFNKYVQNQLNQDTTAAYYKYNDNDLVELEFSVDKAGNPVHIKFLQSLDSPRNARAVDILKHGPKWISAENKKVRIRISF